MRDADRFTLLLVDDNPTNLTLVEKIIEFDLPKVRVVTATSARDGLAVAAGQHIDGAFIDVQMPQMNGLEMCRRLRLDPRTARIPLVLMTAHVASPQLRAEGLEVGAYDFISQPISNVEMLARIKVMLRLCENERRAASSNNQMQQQLEQHTTRLRWISGLLISGEGALAEADQQWIMQLAADLPHDVDVDDRIFFDRVITDFPLPWRRSLLKIALLDSIPLALAREFSEIPDIAAGLEYLNRHGLSLVETRNNEDYLLFRPQTRDLLRRKAVLDLSAEERRQVYLTAANWYRQRDDYVAVLGCLIGAGHFTDVSQLLSQTGPALLHLSRGPVPLPVIDQISDEVAAGCGWLALFRGSNRLHELSPDADVWLELAYQHFGNSGDMRGMLLTLAQQVFQSCYIDGSRERWKERFPVFRETAAAQLDMLVPAERVTVVVALGLAELSYAGRLDRVETLLAEAFAEARQREQNLVWLNLLRARLALLQGRLLVARTALEQALIAESGRPSPLDRVMMHLVVCELLHAAGTVSGLDKQQQLLGREGSLTPQQRTVPDTLLNYYSAGLYLARGQLQAAEQEIDMALLTAQAVKSSHLRSYLVQLRGWLRALRGDRQGALDDLDSGLQLRQDAAGILCRLENLLIAGTTCFVLGLMERAEGYLLEALRDSQATQEERIRLGLHAWLSVIADELGRSGRRERHRQDFFELLRRHRSTYFWGLTPELLSRLSRTCKNAAERTLLQPLVEKYLRARLDEKNRPVALLYLECLGSFRLSGGEDSFDLHQVGQASRQILACLVTSSRLTLSTDMIMGQIWPDSPPSKARNNFDAAHSRLRKGLEGCFGEAVRRDYLVLEKGMLSLRHIRVDAIEFSAALESARYHLQRENFWQAEQILWRMDRLWKGEFLSGYDLGEDLPLRRDYFTRLRLEQLGFLARLLQRREQYGEASRLLRVGLLLDPTQDSMVRQLLGIYQEQQDVRAAAQLLDEYRGTLEREEYSAKDIDELIDALGVQWLNQNKKYRRRKSDYGPL